MKSIAETLRKMEAISERVERWHTDLLTELDEFPIGISIVNAEGFFEIVNIYFCNLLGYKEKELLGQHLSMIIPEKQRKYFTDLHERFINTPFEFNGRFQMEKREGQELDILLTNSLLEIKGEKKRFTLVLGISDQEQFRTQDAPEIGNLKEFIYKLNKKIKIAHSRLESQETAAGIMRHDLKSWLRSIVSISHMLQEHQFSAEEQANMLVMLSDSAEKALQYIESKRKIELMERGSYKLNVTEFDLLGLINEIYQRLEVYFTSKSLKILVQSDVPKRLDGTDQPYFIHADQLFIDMMLTNLIQNAVEASPEKETIIINIKTTLSVEISIHNWGTVPAQVKERFFEKYVTQGKRSGTGLGTYICKMVAEAHHGMINMRSDERTGTYLIVVLPLISISQIGS